LGRENEKMKRLKSKQQTPKLARLQQLLGLFVTISFHSSVTTTNTAKERMLGYQAIIEDS